MKTRKVAVPKSTEVRLPASGRDEGRQVYFVTLHPTGEVEIRPARSRDPSATVHLTIDGIYQGALLRRARADKPKRKQRVTRGLLALERKL